MDFIKVILTSLFSVITLFIIAKVMGHKQVSQLDFFDYISGITIGSIAAELATDLSTPWKSLTALIIYGCASMILEKAALWFPKLRKYINGTPTILMNDGKIYRQNLKKAKLDLSEFLLLCREKGFFDLREIKTAIFEHNGKISVLPYSDKRPATPSDMSLKPEEAHIGTEIIMDGRIMGDNLTRIGRDENWLKNKLQEMDKGNVKHIFLAIYRAQDDSLTVYDIN